MPNYYDFSELREVKEMHVEPQGWISPLFVEYGVGEDIVTYGALSYYWRVKGTKHTFLIPVIRMDFLSSGDYKKHFEDALETFREDYVSWKNEGFITEWSRKYRDEYDRFIVV
jgi:hypothetical protein